MKQVEESMKIGMMAALTAVKKTLSMYPDGMSAEDVEAMLSEIEQQLFLKETELQLMKGA